MLINFQASCFYTVIVVFCKELTTRRVGKELHKSGASAFEGASPGRDHLDMDEHGWKVGDLVWTRVQGYPWWPGQVICVDCAGWSARQISLILRGMDSTTLPPGISCRRIYVPPVQSAEADAAQLTVNVLVWKVMDPEQARDEVRRKQREGSILVCFFGDNEYGWYRADSLVAFWEHYDEKGSQKTAKGHKVWGTNAPSKRNCGVRHSVCILITYSACNDQWD